MATIGESLLRYDEICTDKITPVITAIYSTLFKNTEGFPGIPERGTIQYLTVWSPQGVAVGLFLVSQVIELLDYQYICSRL